MAKKFSLFFVIIILILFSDNSANTATARSNEGDNHWTNGLSQSISTNNSYNNDILYTQLSAPTHLRIKKSAGHGDVNVFPDSVDDVLVNPGMGFADFHFRWYCNLPPVSFTPEQCANRVIQNWPENYPDAATAYFRWHWSDLEPARGEINFNMVDTAIQSANLLGETLSFRVMTVKENDTGIPAWLTNAPYNVPGEAIEGTFWPDYRNDTFQNEHQRFISALAQRYNGHPGIDHVDIGTVGCWGEWNTACISGENNIFDIFDPQTPADYQTIVDSYTNMINHHVDAFSNTPVVMLEIGASPGPEVEVMVHAMEQGAGWRVDCWGDWGLWGSAWNHMEDLYPNMISNITAAYPDFPNQWKVAPVQLEVCGIMSTWHDLGWTTNAPDGKVYKTFQWALAQHASVLNAKSTPVPAAYVDAMNDMLKQNGYRFVIDKFNHFGSIRKGEQTVFVSNWRNIGVAPIYNPRTLTYRLRNGNHSVLLGSDADIRTWMPGSIEVIDTVDIPSDLAAGSYHLDIALLDRAGTEPTTAPLPPLFLGIAGRLSDGWYSISEMTITD